MIGRTNMRSTKSTIIQKTKTNIQIPNPETSERPKTRGKHIYDNQKDRKSDSKLSLAEPEPTRSEPIHTVQQRRRNDQEKDDKETKEVQDNSVLGVSSWFTDKQKKVPFQSLPLLKQRLGHMLEEKFHSDVIFRVGPKEEAVEAHRLILSAASPVFEQLLYVAQPLRFDEKMLLYEPDFSMPIFEVFIRALYTGEVPICLSLDFALEVFYVAKKYDVKFLQKLVLEHVSQVVSVVNVFEALAVSTRMIELTSLIPICWRIIEEETEGVLEHHLETMDMRTFGRILEREQLNLEEVELFQYLVKWAVIRCKRRGVKTTGKLKRQMIEPLLKHIRFPTMKAATIHELVVPARILEPKEVTAILTWVHGMDHKMGVPYNPILRRKPQKPKHTFTGCYSTPRLGIKNDTSNSSANLTHILSSDSENNFIKASCTKIKSQNLTVSKSKAPISDLNSPRPRVPRVKKSPSKNSKRPLRSHR